MNVVTNSIPIPVVAVLILFGTVSYSGAGSRNIECNVPGNCETVPTVDESFDDPTVGDTQFCGIGIPCGQSQPTQPVKRVFRESRETCDSGENCCILNGQRYGRFSRVRIGRGTGWVNQRNGDSNTALSSALLECSGDSGGWFWGILDGRVREN